MAYFVTGGTGFIGRRLVARLAARDVVHVLVREGSQARFEAQRSAAGLDPQRVVAVEEPHPRKPEFVTSEKFAVLRNQLYDLLHGEIRKAVLQTGLGASSGALEGA